MKTHAPLVALAAVLAAVASLAEATTYTVTSTADTDGVTCAATCTLRQALNASNAAGGTNTSDFAISGNGPQGKKVYALGHWMSARHRSLTHAY